MSENSTDFSEEPSMTDHTQSKNKPTRRDILRAGLGVAASLYGGLSLRNAFKEISKDLPHENSTASNDQVTTDISQKDQNPVITIPEDSFYDSLSIENKELVDVTTDHLMKVYGKNLNSAEYPTDVYKKAFWKKLSEIGLQLSPNNPNMANQMAAVMAWESGFSPSIRSNNKSNGVGLIQFTGDIPENLNTTRDALLLMPALEQITFVEKYYQAKRDDLGVQFSTLEDVYAAVIAPAAIGKDPSTVLYAPGSNESNHNLAIDNAAGNKDGIITLHEATQAVFNIAVELGENPKFLLNS